MLLAQFQQVTQGFFSTQLICSYVFRAWPFIQASLLTNSGASVCISPHHSDFVTCNNSKMKIKDLSSSNHVAGEGIIRWTLGNKLGNPVTIKVLGYHIRTAEDCLLSSQVLLNTIGGDAIFDESGIKFNLHNGHHLLNLGQ